MVPIHCSFRGRLPVASVLAIERLVGGDPVTERHVLRFIGFQFTAKNLLYVPLDAARQIELRPGDFLRAARRHCEPELNF